MLLAAVPLYACDYTLRDEAARHEPRRCWFSDGGICSNFPIHLFDSVWPRWPTFGITLGKYDAERHREPVWLPQGARQGILREFGEIATLPSFLCAIVGTMKDWRDGLQTVLPGYRERVVRIALRKDEGGLNLDMPPAKIRRLFGYGREAGENLRDRFDFDAHRWRRYLVAMGRLESVLEQVEGSWTDREDGREPLPDFLARYADAPAEYRQTREWRDAAARDTEDLMHGADGWLARRSLRGDSLPKPDPEFRITPRV